MGLSHDRQFLRLEIWGRSPGLLHDRPLPRVVIWVLDPSSRTRPFTLTRNSPVPSG